MARGARSACPGAMCASGAAPARFPSWGGHVPAWLLPSAAPDLWPSLDCTVRSPVPQPFKTKQAIQACKDSWGVEPLPYKPTIEWGGVFTPLLSATALPWGCGGARLRPRDEVRAASCTASSLDT